MGGEEEGPEVVRLVFVVEGAEVQVSEFGECGSSVDGGPAGDGEGGLDGGSDVGFLLEEGLPVFDGLAFEDDAGGVAYEAVRVLDARPSFSQGVGAWSGVVKLFETEAAVSEVVGSDLGRGGRGGTQVSDAV